MSIDGTWDVIYSSQLGDKQMWWRFGATNDELSGCGSGEDDDGRITTFEKGTLDGDRFAFEMQLTAKIRLRVSGEVDGDTIAGVGKVGLFKAGRFSGKRRPD